MMPGEDQFTPKFPDLNAGVLAGLCPDISDETLIRDMFANPRLHDLLVKRAMKNAGLTEDRLPLDFPGLGVLRAALDLDRDRLLLTLGCAYNANRIAHAVAEGTFKPASASIPRELLQCALQLREHASPAMGSEGITRSGLEHDGAATFCCWVEESFPHEIAQRVRLQLPEGCAVPDRDDRERRSLLCLKVIDELTAQERAA